MHTRQASRIETNLICSLAIALAVFAQSSCLAQKAQNRPSASNNALNSDSSARPENAQSLPEWQGSDLQQAVLREDLTAIRKLLTQKVNVEEKDNYGNTALFNAVSQKIREPKPRPAAEVRRELQKEKTAQIGITRELLAHGANANQPGHFGMTPLIKAAANSYDSDHTIKILTLLIQHGADVNLQDDQGYTALMLAARTNRPEVVRFLLGHSANPELTNHEGKTALAIAQSSNHAAVIHVLQQTK